MALTLQDVKLIKEALQPEFDRINIRLDKLEQRMNRLELRMDKIERRMDLLEVKVNMLESTLTAAFREIVNDMYDLHPSKDEFNLLEGRVTIIEHKIN